MTKDAANKQLIAMAQTALKNHGGDIEKALPKFLRAVQGANLIDDLARECLRSVAMSEPGLRTRETQMAVAGLAPSRGSIKVPKYDVPPHRRRTHEEKQAADRAMMASAEAVFEIQIEGRAIGGIAMGELPRLKRDLFKSAAEGIMLHTIEVRNAIIAEMIELHCTVPDTLMRVRDAVDAPTLIEFVSQAERLAPRRIEDAMRHARETLEKHEQKEIAA